jgi:hypothetical protein
MNPAGSMNGFCCRKEGGKEDDVPWDAEESSCLQECFLLLQAGRKEIRKGIRGRDDDGSRELGIQQLHTLINAFQSRTTAHIGNHIPEELPIFTGLTWAIDYGGSELPADFGAFGMLASEVTLGPDIYEQRS